MTISPRTQRWFFVIFSLVLTVALFIPIPLEGRVKGAIGDSLHAPAFAVFAFLLYRAVVGLTRLNARTLGLIICLSLILFGITTEVIQYWVGRNCSYKDIFANSFGIIAGTLLAASMDYSGSHRKLRMTALGVIFFGMTLALINLADAIIQHYEFPVIASFEQPLEKYRWKRWWCTTRRSSRHATGGERSLQIDLQPGLYPGIGTSALIADWSKYKELVFDIELDDGPPLDWCVKIIDRQSRLTPEVCPEWCFELEPGRHQIVVPLSDVETDPNGHQLDLYRIHYLQLFTVDLKAPRTVFIDNIRLR